MLFISHRITDKVAAEDLKRRALAQGYSAEQLFLDTDVEAGIAAGENWRHVIYNRLKQCRALIVVYSPRWRETVWCPAELGAAETLGKQIFPVVIEDCAIEAILSERQAVFPYRDGEAAFTRLWKSLEQHGLGPHEYRPWPPDNGDPCPFPGLLAFNERFAPVYFGRQPETTAVLEELNKMRDRGEPRLLMIHGGSGSGKSSLLRAGVLPRLDHHREQTDWLVLPTLRYGQSPNDDLTLLARLAQELAACFPPNTTSRPNWEDLQAKFESDDAEQAAQNFIKIAQRLTFARGCRDATILLPIDQFEELLTAAARPSAEQFLRFLHALLSRNNCRLLVIGTLRSDYLDVYERHPHALQPPYLQTYRLPPFPWERVTDVIVQPAARVGVTFTNELLERLKLDAPTSDALPLLAFTLEKLFRECTADNLIELIEYESLGGMIGAITQAVEKLLPSKLPSETEQALRLSFVRHLVQVNEKDEFFRRPARWSQLPPAARPLLEQFVNERLLHTSGDGSDTTIEVSHEALFRCWLKLDMWLNAERNNLRLRRKLEVAVEEWNQSITTSNPNGDQDLFFTLNQLEAVEEWKHDVKLEEVEERFLKASRDKRNSDTQREIERLQQLAEAERKKQQAEAQRTIDAIRFSRRLKWAVIGTTAVALVAIVLGVVALYQRSIAIEQTGVANEKTELAESETEKAKESDAKATTAMQLAQSAEFINRADLLRETQGPKIEESLRLAHEAYRLARDAGAPTENAEHAVDQASQLIPERVGEAWAPFTSPVPVELHRFDDRLVVTRDAAAAPDEPYALVAGFDRATQTWKPTQTFHRAGHGDRVANQYGDVVELPSTARWLATRKDGNVVLWDVGALDKRLNLPFDHAPGAKDGEELLAFNSDGTFALARAQDQLIVWDIRERQRKRNLSRIKYSGAADAYAISPSGQWIAWARQNEFALAKIEGTIPRMTYSITQQGGHVESLGFVKGPNDREDQAVYVSWSANQIVARGAAPRRDAPSHQAAVWDLASGELGGADNETISELRPDVLLVREGHFNLAFAGTVMAVLDASNPVQLLDTESQVSFTLGTAAGPAINGHFSPQGHAFLAVHTDGTARLWNQRTREEMFRFAVSGKIVDAVFLGPQSMDDSLQQGVCEIVTLDEGGHIQGWNTRRRGTGREP